MAQSFCWNCGTQIIVSQAKFCMNCGANLLQQVETESPQTHKEIKIPEVLSEYFSKMPDLPPVVKSEEKPLEQPNAILFQLASKFRNRLILLRIYSNPTLYFMTIWGTGFFGGILGGFLQNVDFIKKFVLSLPFSEIINNEAISFVFFGVLVFFLIFVVTPIFIFFYTKMMYKKTVYTIYKDKIEYVEGFLSIEKKSITLKRILEVHLRKGFIQKMFGLGSIHLEIPNSASGGRNGSWWEAARNGIYLKDIENSDEIYQKMKKIVNEQR